MARYLHRVFASIRIGRTKESDEYFIEHRAISANEMAEDGGACFALGKRSPLYGAEVLTGDGNGLGTANTDDADGSTLSGGNGTDGIGCMPSVSLVSSLY